MKNSNYILSLIILSVFIFNCNTTKQIPAKKDDLSVNSPVNDTVKIVNDELEYKIIIIDPGYASWLVSNARPEGFYTQQYMENRNNIYALEWNRRVMLPQQYSPNLYELSIDYNPHIDYGYEVNYKLYNYFIYFQMRYNQRLGPFTPRI
ncbi:DUF6146 family protein [Seonamhaeicola sp. MEBiC1930]|uniref:DUF6146 family protein n=1 Tax=Seonamhaeicola sp. MEBiC01930 TaxID=2976768 RepID=UPI003245C322